MAPLPGCYGLAPGTPSLPLLPSCQSAACLSLPSPLPHSSLSLSSLVLCTAAWRGFDFISSQLQVHQLEVACAELTSLPKPGLFMKSVVQFFLYNSESGCKISAKGVGESEDTC